MLSNSTNHCLQTAAPARCNKVLSALKVFYQDTNLPLPAFDDYVAINEDLDSTMLMPVGNCAKDFTKSSAFGICFTFELD